MTKDEELERLYKAYDEQHELFKQLHAKQAEAHRYQLEVLDKTASRTGKNIS